MHDFIQDLFKEGCADPEVLDGLRRQVGQLRHLAHVLRDALDLISSLEVQGKRQQHHRLIPEHRRSLAAPHGARGRGSSGADCGGWGMPRELQGERALETAPFIYSTSTPEAHICI